MIDSPDYAPDHRSFPDVRVDRFLPSITFAANDANSPIQDMQGRRFMRHFAPLSRRHRLRASLLEELMRFGLVATLCAVFAVLLTGSAAATPASSARIARAIETEVSEMVAGINAHDVARATQFDAPGIITMESGRAPSTGADADRQGMGMAMQYSPSWHLTMLDEAVDVASAGDMAIYRGTYNEDSVNDGAPMTHVVNFIADFKKQRDGAWKIEWSVVCAQTRSHPVNPSIVPAPPH